jgi:hypothetical protein
MASSANAKPSLCKTSVQQREQSVTAYAKPSIIPLASVDTANLMIQQRNIHQHHVNDLVTKESSGPKIPYSNRSRVGAVKVVVFN